MNVRKTLLTEEEKDAKFGHFETPKENIRGWIDVMSKRKSTEGYEVIIDEFYKRYDLMTQSEKDDYRAEKIELDELIRLYGVNEIPDDIRRQNHESMVKFNNSTEME